MYGSVSLNPLAMNGLKHSRMADLTLQMKNAEEDQQIFQHLK